MRRVWVFLSTWTWHMYNCACPCTGLSKADGEAQDRNLCLGRQQPVHVPPSCSEPEPTAVSEPRKSLARGGGTPCPHVWQPAMSNRDRLQARSPGMERAAARHAVLAIREVFCSSPCSYRWAILLNSYTLFFSL